MTNTGTTAVTFTITSNHYRSGTWTYRVAPGATAKDYFNAVTIAQGWYDFTVTVSGDNSWSRRAIGHIETGTASISG
jgi:phospholipase C